MINLFSWVPILENIEGRYTEYMENEQAFPRSKIQDNRIHACLYFIPPLGHSLRQIDIEAMYHIGNRVNLIPVIAKSDIMTTEEISATKEAILANVEKRKIQIYIPPTFPDDDAESVAEMNTIAEKIPFAVVGSNREIADSDGSLRRIREYPWGVVDIGNPMHCDFTMLRQLLIRTNMEEMRNYTQVVLYESFRSAKLHAMGRENDLPISDVFSLGIDGERENHKQRLLKMEHDMTVVFQSKVEEKEDKLKKSESELQSRHREMREMLERHRTELEEKKRKLEALLLQMGSSTSTPERSRKKGYFK